MPVFGLEDPEQWYEDIFGRKPRPMRYDESYKHEWPFLIDEVDFRVREMIVHLSRGNMNRLLTLLPGHRSKTVFYGCVRGDSVGDDVATDFETAFTEWFWSPNFDSPPHPPPDDDLGPYVKNYVGTRGWLAEQVGLRELDVANALAGRSKKHEAVLREYLRDFYARRCAMDTLNPDYDEEMKRFEVDRYWFVRKALSIALELYHDERSAWRSSDAGRALARRQRELDSFPDAFDSLRREGVDLTMATLNFESWCHLHRRRLYLQLPNRPNPPVQWNQAPPPKRLNP